MLSNTLRDALIKFRHERDWQQFHSPQNLAVAIAVEAGELLEHFQWMKAGEERPRAEGRDEVGLELADLVILLTYLAHDLNLDLEAAVRRKLALNAERYPVEKARGSSVKYDKL